MPATLAGPEHPQGSAVQDGLGERLLVSEVDSGEVVQVLRLPVALTDVPAFEFALRERTLRLATLRHTSCARVYRVDRVEMPASALVMVSQHVEGARLSDLLHVAHERAVGVDISTALSVIRQLLPAVTLVHEHAPDVSCGLIAPERLIVTPRGRIVVAEQALGGAIEQLHYSPDRLWRAFRIAVDPGAASARFSHRTDVMSIGLVALAMMLGRPLRQEEFPERIPLLLDEARERSALGHDRKLSPPLREWLARALQLQPGGSFASTPEAWLAFEKVIAADPLYISIPIALEMFLYSCTAARIPPPAVAQLPDRELTPATPVAETAGGCSTQDSGPASGGGGDEVPQSGPAARESRASGTPSESIDWTTLAAQPALVATSSDIARLFSDADRGASDASAAEPEAAVSSECSFDPPDALNEDGHGLLSEPMLEAVPQVMHDAPADRRWVRAIARDPQSLRRRAAIAAVIVGLLVGGLLLTRWIRPTVMAASEMGTLLVETDPPGLQVLVDGVEQGLTPSRLSVPAGEHTLEVRGRNTVRVIPFTIAAGTEVSQHLELAAAPETGQLQVESAAAGASVVIDGITHGTTPLTVTDLAPGDREVVLRTPAGASRHHVTIRAGMTSSLRVPALESSTPPPYTGGWLAVKAPFPVEIHLGGRLVATTSGQRIRIAEGRHQIEFRNTREAYRAVRVVHVTAGKVTDVVLDTGATEP
jgi:hypothetical protein